MGKWKPLLDISRYERVGAIVLALLLVGVLALHQLMPQRGDETVPAAPDVEQFGQQCDSVVKGKNPRYKPHKKPQDKKPKRQGCKSHGTATQARKAEPPRPLQEMPRIPDEGEK